MLGNKGLTPEDFGASFKGFMDTMAAQTPAPEPVFCQMLEKHFETDPAVLPVVTESFSAADHPNLQVALDDYLAASGRSAQLLGIAGEHPYLGVSLAALVTRGGSALYSRGLPHRVPDWDKYVGQTEGVSAAFIRELLRQAALFAADDAADFVVEERHLDGALHELVVQGGELTRILLGVQRQKSVTGFATSPQK